MGRSHCHVDVFHFYKLSTVSHKMKQDTSKPAPTLTQGRSCGARRGLGEGCKTRSQIRFHKSISISVSWPYVLWSEPQETVSSAGAHRESGSRWREPHPWRVIWGGGSLSVLLYKTFEGFTDTQPVYLNWGDTQISKWLFYVELAEMAKFFLKFELVLCNSV